jgi:hypothetical protein
VWRVSNKLPTTFFEFLPDCAGNDWHMIFKNSWLWILLAVLLSVLSLLHYRHARTAHPGPARILPQLKASAVTNIQLRVERKLQFRAGRAGASWNLSEPVHYPADSARIENLLTTLERLTPALYISRRELVGRPAAEDEYGFSSPQAMLFLKQPDYEAHLYIGARSAPGDQVFIQVVGDEGIYVVSSELLNLIPQSPNDWRDTVLLDLNALTFDRVAVTNGGKGFELRLDETNQLWRIVTSDFAARADKTRIKELLEHIAALRIKQFVSDEPAVDLESRGLQNPEFQFAVANGTNGLVILQFGKSPTNDSAQVFARRLGQNAIVTVDRSGLNPWPTQLTFRDPHLISAKEDFAAIEVQGGDNFSLLRLTNGSWQVMPQNFVADQESISNLCATLSGIQIVQYKDTVPEQGLSNYGLDKPFLKYVLQRPVAGSPMTLATNLPLGLHFGTNQEDKVWVRRTDETDGGIHILYAIKTNDYQCLATTSWQFRDHRVWSFSINDLASVTIHQGGKAKQMVRTGDHRWSLSAGSQGIIDGMAVEETVIDLVNLSATEWLGRGEKSRAWFGFAAPDHTITLEFKNGEKRTFELGAKTAPDFPVAAVILDGEPWVFRIPPLLCRDVLAYLSIAVAAL